MARLTDLTGLGTLIVAQRPRVSDAGLALLSRLPGLTSLDVSGCEDVTRQRLALFRSLVALYVRGIALTYKAMTKAHALTVLTCWRTDTVAVPAASLPCKVQQP